VQLEELTTVNKEVSPAVVIVATLVVLTIIGLISIKLFDSANRPAPYVAGITPPGLDKHPNTPPGDRPAGDSPAAHRN
jgi:hypothetical protein